MSDPQAILSTKLSATSVADRPPFGPLRDVLSSTFGGKSKGAGGPQLLRTATRRYRRKYSNPKPSERTQNWIRLGGKVSGLPRMDTFEKPLWWLLNLFGLGRILLKQEPWSGTGLL
ncbi:hypothetical protein CO674_34840 [Rhizobium hidalgonense]|uniref:Uncharacterized protein n=1 Tax=Rhizobium hidalgonense TaxID=1538159 RepID=A0ABX4JGF8_9HYPH|nr:hypothetical protein RPHASCH2410_PC00690 [Rhizobium phaseoli Ch24-10]PDT19127.1 hypothetical protein CO674_34840 [Rhizobium hidalgonense]